MSNLDALVGLDAAMGKSSRVERASKPRLIADPSVSVADLMKVLRDFVTQKDCKDILSLVVPAGHRNFSWKTAVDPNWLQRMSSLVFDILAIAPNSKVQGKKLEQALKKMLVDGDLKNESKRDDKTYIDSVNQLIRIALSQFRTLKTDIAKREICYKRLSPKEKKGFALILDRLQLPADYENLQSDEEQEVSCVETKKWWHTLQLILMRSPPLVQFWKVLPCQPLALHHLITKDMAGFKSEDVRRAKKLSMQSVGMRFADSPPPSIPQLSIKKQKTEYVDPKTGLGSSRSRSLDDEVLKAAMKHVPREADPKAKANKVSKRPSMMKRPSSSAGAVQEVVQAGVRLKKVQCI